METIERPLKELGRLRKHYAVTPASILAVAARLPTDRGIRHGAESLVFRRVLRLVLRLTRSHRVHSLPLPIPAQSFHGRIKRQHACVDLLASRFTNDFSAITSPPGGGKTNTTQRSASLGRAYRAVRLATSMPARRMPSRKSSGRSRRDQRRNG